MAIYSIKCKSLKPVRCAVTVEPMMFFYFLTTVMSTYVGTNMLLHKGCDPDATAAPDLKTAPRCLFENSAQHGVSSINVWKHLIQELLSVTFVVFAGPWSDNHGRRRRPLMFVPVFGQILCDALNILFAVFWRDVSPTVAGIAQSVTVSTTGSYICFLIGVFAYLSDVTGQADRTMRLGLASAILPLAATVGVLSAGFLNVSIGFIGVFILNIAVNVLALGLGCLFVYDTSEPYTFADSLYTSTFDPNIVVKSFKTVFVKRDHHKRLILLLMIVASPLTGAPFIGELNLMYLYLRNQFGFNEIHFSLFHGYVTVVMLLGSVFTLTILSHIYKINDAVIGLIATFFDIATAVGFLLVTQYKYLLYVPLLELFRGIALSLSSSIASKCVEPHELGSMNSMRMVAENLSKSAILPLYNIVYNRTLETMPSAYFIISICLTVPLIGCFATTYYLTRDEVTSNEIQGNNLEDKSNDVDVNSTKEMKLKDIA